MTFGQKDGFVIPAQAGIQPRRYGNLSGKTVSLDFAFRIPTFAGMTNFRFLFLVFCPCGNLVGMMKF
ncbi:hypothetical protein GVE94_002207, partial [Neisseria gonorrhoeae]